MTEVLIFVPGLMGSELWDDEGKVWPGNLKDLILGLSDEKFGRLLAEDLNAKAIALNTIGIVDLYGMWIDAFSSLRSRETGEALFSDTSPLPTLLTVPYDWRKSISLAAQRLAETVERALGMHGDGTRIHIAAHSMGGLVSRYYLQSGKYSKFRGLEQIRSLLTFGTPHKGAPVALAGALGLHAPYFLTAKQSQQLSNDTRFIGLYELFPQPGALPIWERGAKDKRLRGRDAFEPDIVAAFGLEPENVKRAMQTISELDTDSVEARQFFFVGNRLETITHFTWDGRTVVPVRTRDGGDGTVSLQGAMLENQQIQFGDKNHLSLIKSVGTRAALHEIFSADGLLTTAIDTEVIINVSDSFVESRSSVEIALNISGPGQSLEGILFIEKARTVPTDTDLSAENFKYSERLQVQNITYSGPQMTSLHVLVDELVGPGVFRPVFETLEDLPRRFLGPAFAVKRP